MTITPQELAIKFEGQEKQVSKLEGRIAAIEGDMASSWALKTKDDYEKTFKDSIKDDMRGLIARLAISAVLILEPRFIVSLKVCNRFLIAAFISVRHG